MARRRNTFRRRGRGFKRRRVAIRRKRTFRRRMNRRGNKVRQTVVRGVNYVGDRAIVRFKQETQINTKQAAAAFATRTVIGGNYIGAAATSLPTFSNWSSLYNQFRVLKSTVVATFTNIEAAFSKDVGVTQLPLNATNTVTPAGDVYLSEQPRTKSAYLTPLSGSFSRKKIVNRGNTATAFGSRTAVTGNDDLILSSAPTALPAEDWSWVVWTQNVSGAGSLETAGTNIRIMVYYTIEFLQRIQVTD